MKASHVAALLAISCLGGITAFPDHGRADDILIEATGQTTWKAGGSQSDGPDNPLIVLAKKDDVLEIKALAGPHGFATLNKKGNKSPAVEPKFVVACGETPDTKPDAVFLETECSRIRQTTFREHEAESVGQVPERYPFLVCHPSVGYVGHEFDRGRSAIGLPSNAEHAHHHRHYHPGMAGNNVLSMWRRSSAIAVTRSLVSVTCALTGSSA